MISEYLKSKGLEGIKIFNDPTRIEPIDIRRIDTHEVIASISIESRIEHTKKGDMFEYIKSLV